jgi:membrane-associated protease RseP (regulator of RpoE activity)
VDELIPAFEAWRVMRFGDREYVDAVVAPAHRSPSPGLASALARWPGSWYWTAPDRSGVVLVRTVGAARKERWLFHAVLFTLTLLCALGAGAALSGAWLPPLRWSPYGPLAAAISGGIQFIRDALGGGWRQLLPGLPFAASLLGILLVHELGHYFAARRYHIDTSPPFFLPVPPTLSPIGSLGAFIRMRSPVLDRRQLLDVGAAGPLAGFVVAIGVLLWGYTTSEPMALGPDATGEFVTFAGRQIQLGSSLLTLGLREVFFPQAGAIYLSPPAFAGWVGAFVTALNLLPLSQLDGGHVLYAMFGRRQTAIGGCALLALFVLGFSAPSWWVWGVLALVVGGGRWSHPSVVAPERAVPRRRRWIGWACIAVFVLTFVPLPFGR